MKRKRKKKLHPIPWIPNVFQANTWSLFCSEGKADVKESRKSLSLRSTFLSSPRSHITKLPCSFFTSESKSGPCPICWPEGAQPLFLLSGGHQSKVRILAPSSYPCFQEVHRRYFVKLAVRLNGLLFFLSSAQTVPLVRAYFVVFLL